MLSENGFVMFYVFSFPIDVYVGTLNLIASIHCPCILTFHRYINTCITFIVTVMIVLSKSIANPTIFGES